MIYENAILASFRAGIIAMQLDGTVAYINPIGEKILEFSPIRAGDNIHHRAGENQFFHILSQSISMNYLPTRVEVELSGKDGESQYLGFTLSELNKGDLKIGICAFFKDLTNVEMTEESEDRKQRLLMLGQMAAGLAHEIRNPIASIGVHCGILRTHLASNERLIASVNMMGREIEKVEFIIRECLNFVRPAELGVQKVRIDTIIEGIIGRLSPLHPKMDFTVRKPDKAELTAEVDGRLLEQAIGNIIVNAVEACDGNGKVEITFGISRHINESFRMDRRFEPLVPGESFREEEFLRINIRDNGPGIPMEVRDRIFVPFYTTKKTGTGIGLAMAQKIIHAHGGVLDLKSEPGIGTEFIVKIPVRQNSG